MIPAIMAKTAACFDPYLYAVTHPRFRTELNKMFCSGDQSGNFQTSYQSRVGRHERNESECETVQLDATDYADRKKKPLQRADSSFGEESTVSDIADTQH